ncbi:lysophosphatidylserine lipase ABHD12-like [Diretmus argenteus]
MIKVVLFVAAAYASVPVLFYLFPWVLGQIVYCNLWPPYLSVDLGRPEEVLNHTSNFYLTTEEGITVGVWHTLPASQWGKAAGKGPEWYSEALGDGRPVILYLHGNVGSRAKRHRVELMKILSAAGYHVVSFDYRGYGDSSGKPSETGMTTDAVYLYQWVMKHSAGVVCVWGHSLGSGVATNTALKLQELGMPIDALVLEAPYTSIGDVLVDHRLARPYMVVPGLESLLWHILELNNIVFGTEKNLQSLTCPLLLLHSEDDDVIPYYMGKKLYQQYQVQGERKVQVEMVSYSASLGYNHKNIYLDPNLPNHMQETPPILSCKH